MKRIGLIAGSGQFPIIFSDKAKSSGYEVYAVAHLKETRPDLDKHVAGIKWIHLGQIKKLIRFFQENQVTEAVMVGAIKKTRMFTDVRPDTKLLSLVAGLRHTHDDGFLRAFARLLEKEGIRIQESTMLLPEILAEPGCWTKRKPNKTEMKDVEEGWRLAKEIGRLDIGQCVVVARGSILAVEAIDGTDATILRGGKLGQGNSVVVKVCKPNQDDRFDIPAIGANTIETMQSAGVKVLAVEAGKAVVFDKEEMIALANQYGISILSLDREA